MTKITRIEPKISTLKEISGTRFTVDPKYAKVMLEMMDEDKDYKMHET